MHRPSKKEIINKVRDALDAVRESRRVFALRKHLVADLDELKLKDESEYWQLIEQCLEEIYDANPLHCYAGGDPPQRSYEAAIEGMELWAYAWDSPTQGRRMYLKFAFKNTYYFHVDCHEDRPRE